LDSDTRFLTGDVQNLFSVLDEFDIGIGIGIGIGIMGDSPDVSVSVSVSVRNYRRQLFNAGVMLFRKCDIVARRKRFRIVV
jgi:hypothetical protein